MSTDIERTVPADSALGPLIFHYDAADDADVAATLAAYTHTCGYVRAWVDLIDPLRVWYLLDCPADALIIALQAAIDAFLPTQITDVEAYLVDPYDQVQALINWAIGGAEIWIDANAYNHLATFLKTKVMREQILLSLSRLGYTN